MRIHYLILSLAVIMLWVPLALLVGRRVRHELRNPVRGVLTLVTLPALLRSPWAWVDLLRAAGGAWLLMYHAVLLPPSPATTNPRFVLIMLGGQVAVLIAGVWIQIMLTGSRRLRLAPLFYVLGIMVVLLPWQVSVFGGVLGLALTGMLRRWQLVFWLVPATLIAASVLFRKLGLPVALITLLCLLPGLLGLRLDRPLSWVIGQSQTLPGELEPSRRNRRRHDSPPSSTRY